MFLHCHYPELAAGLDTSVREGFDEGTAEEAVRFVLGAPEINVAPDIPGILEAFDGTGQRLTEMLIAAQECLEQAQDDVARGCVTRPILATMGGHRSMDEFAECYVMQVGTTVDHARADLDRIGADGIRQFVTWWRSSNCRVECRRNVAAYMQLILIRVSLKRFLSITC